LAFSNAGASDKTIAISALPSQPAVHNVDYTYTDEAGNVITVPAPWFSFKININNKSKNPLTIVGVHVTVTGRAPDGTVETSDEDFSPEENNFTNANLACTYADYGQFDPGGTPSGPSFNNTTLFTVPDSDSTASCPMITENVFYMGDLPTAGMSGATDYQVTVEPVGWLGSRTHQKDGFDDSISFKTQ
jgi:hypothetical protein